MGGAKHYAYLADNTFHDPKKLARAFRKLHRQFGRTSPSRLAKTILTAYPDVDKRNLDAIVKMFSGEICGKHSNPVKRPLAANPRVPEFNHEVGADLFWVNKVAFLHVVCTFTLYSQVERVMSTQGDHVRGKFMRMWTRYFGGPKKLKLDLGPEFDNVFVDQLRDTLGCENHRSPRRGTLVP